MISYKSLLEELSPENKKQVSMWMRSISHKAATRISEQAMGGEKTIYLPLEHPEEDHSGKINGEVLHHLQKNGHSVASFQDYRAGMAVDKHGRMVKIESNQSIFLWRSR